MDVLKPAIVDIDGRRYRKPATLSSSGNSDRMAVSVPCDAEDAFPDNFDGETLQLEQGVEQVAQGYRLRMDVPSVLYKYLIGKQGRTRRHMEEDTGCQIRIPRQGEEGPIEITAKLLANVQRGRTQVDMVAESGRRKEDSTHFVAICLNQPDIKDRLAEFTEECLQKHGSARGVVREVFQLPAKLHLTIGMMKLFSQREKDEVEKVVAECIERHVRSIVRGSPLLLQLRGLEIMGDDPSQAHILYIKAQPMDRSHRLQTLVNTVAKECIEAGVMEKNFGRDTVKIHVTVMNSGWRVKAGEQRRGRRSEDAFDIRGILKDYHSFDFGQVEVTSLHILTRGVYDQDGGYKVLKQFHL